MTGRPSVDDRLAAAGLPPLPRTAWLEIDLDRLRANLAAFRAAVPAGVRIEPVVKADAYGHGAVEVARALEAAGADGFSVAAFDEAVELRAAGIRAPILCLYAVRRPSCPRRCAWASRSRPRATSCSSGWGRRRGRVAGPPGRRPGGRCASTSTSRRVSDAPVSSPSASPPSRVASGEPGVRLAGIWSHIQQADDRPRTAAQGARFGQALERLTERAAGARASPGGQRGAARRGSCVRRGPDRPGDVWHRPRRRAAGGRGADRQRHPADPVLARPAGQGCRSPGRNRDQLRPDVHHGPPSRIATLPLGYGDGFPRVLSNRAEALVRGRRVPLVGNVAMDAVMADVTDVPGRPVTVDDEFVLIGTQGSQTIALEDLARLRTTNTWETVTALSRRLPRVYHAAAVPVATRALALWREP